MNNLKQFSIFKGDEDSLPVIVKVVFDLSHWKDKIKSIINVADEVFYYSAFDKDIEIYLTANEVGLRYEQFPNYPLERPIKKGDVVVPLTDNFEENLKALAKIVREDYYQLLEDGRNSDIAHSEFNGKNERAFNDACDWVKEEFSWIKD